MFCLVYENIPKQNLVNLFRRHPLKWDTTMKIAIGAAQGLAFLHNAESRPINRTFSASSVLLNEDFEAKLYFGSASLVRAHGVLPVVMSYAVTSRYTPPEYMTRSHWYVESDIYAFGVMMLDMISGSYFLNGYPCTSPHSLVVWLRPILTNKTELQRIMDPWLEHGNPPKGVHKVVELILTCLEDDPHKRPSMKQVLASLERIKAIEM
ncbi:probable serine/threonine-protein kinase PIX13 [Rutidosis leptorrhynchoides]|uniref:probable serine/threonine-protein kinase PIX13 n=1 Tax=Rutidosis leptorrhynchoides TaxID=125765 RepID=UPI003A98F064